MAPTGNSKRSYKRLCVFSDGTWQTPETERPSNIVRLAKTVLPEDDDGVQQIVCYDKGIGTGGLVDKYVGGMFGEGIDIKIQELYSFLALNYDDGDEIYLFGFSRGAYTVRSLAGMIHNAGLVRRDHLDFVEEAYELYREKVGADTEEAKTFRSIHGHRVPITCVACFDTVGALGIPDNFGVLSLRSRRRYEFLNTTLNPDIQNAIHVLSIDEERAPYKPTLMVPNDLVPDQVTELYFWGVHSGVGGSSISQPESGDATILFMIDEMEKRGLGLRFRRDLLPEYPNMSVQGREAKPEGVFALMQVMFGKYVRDIQGNGQLHISAVQRYQQVASWRPDALARIGDRLLKLPTVDYENQPE